MAKKSKSSAVASSKLPVLADMLVSVLHYDKSELRSLIESRLKPQVVRYLERGLGRPVAGEDAYYLHLGLDPGLDPVTLVYAEILRLCVQCEDQGYSDGACLQLIMHVLVAAQYRLADTIRKEHRYARRGAGPAAAKAKARKTDSKVLRAWNGLANKPEHNRASLIAQKLGMPLRTVHGSIRRLRRDGKIK